MREKKLHWRYNGALGEIGKQGGLPLVATNDCHYLHRDDAKAHEVLLCIQTGKTMADETRWRFDTDELYVKTPEEMIAAFGADSEEIRNTVAIANQVDFEFAFDKFNFPIFCAPETKDESSEKDLDAILERSVRAGLAERLAEQ